MSISNWKLISQALDKKGIHDEINRRALLATVLVETGSTLMPVRERGTYDYFVEHYWTNVNTRLALGNIVKDDATTYRGRGFIQTTGRKNYELTARALNLPLMSQPERLEQPLESAMAAVHFWCEIGKLPALIHELGQYGDRPNRDAMWRKIRQRVNGRQARGLEQFLAFLDKLGVR